MNFSSHDPAQGALPFAALLHSPPRWKDRTVVVVVSGGNIAPARFRAVTGPA